jgi:hypothetical protein
MTLPFNGIPALYICCHEPVGSQVTCNPPPPLTESDVDYLCYSHSTLFGKLDEWLYHNKWESGGSKPEDCDAANGFTSYTKVIDGIKYNIIATADYDFYMKFLNATSLAKQFNLLKKEDRIRLFQAVLYGN